VIHTHTHTRIHTLCAPCTHCRTKERFHEANDVFVVQSGEQRSLCMRALYVLCVVACIYICTHTLTHTHIYGHTLHYLSLCIRQALERDLLHHELLSVGLALHDRHNPAHTHRCMVHTIEMIGEIFHTKPHTHDPTHPIDPTPSRRPDL
jgi:hypothetical protein